MRDTETGEFTLREVRFICSSNQVQPGSYEMMKLTDQSHSFWSDPSYSTFVLHKLEDGGDGDKFRIQMPYGDIQPRLISYDRDIRMYSQLASSARTTLGYNVDE